MLHVPSVSAQAVGLSLTPSLFQIAVQPGKSTTVTYRLQNTADPTTLTLRILPFTKKDDAGHIELQSKLVTPLTFSLESSETTLGQAFFFKSRNTIPIKLHIQVPENTPEGDYYYSLLAESEPPPPAEGSTQVRVKASVGSNILLSVTRSGKLEIRGKIRSFSLSPHYTVNLFSKKVNIYDINDSVQSTLIVENSGKNLIRPSGEVNLIGSLGGRAKYDLPAENVLANSTRKLPVSLRGFYIGPYRLTTAVSFGEGAPVLFAQTSFIVVPIKFLTFMGVGGLLGLLFLIYRKRKAKK